LVIASFMERENKKAACRGTYSIIILDETDNWKNGQCLGVPAR